MFPGLGGGACGVISAGAEGAPWLELEVRLERGVDLREVAEHCEHVDKHEDDSKKERERGKKHYWQYNSDVVN